MAELLVEALSEEIPARMQRRAAEDLAQIFEAELKKVGLLYEIAEHFITPVSYTHLTLPTKA